jgi:hypothetical protein
MTNPETSPLRGSSCDSLKKYLFIILGVILLFAVLLQGTLSFFKAHPVNATVSHCVLNLDAIAEAKIRWMNDNNKTSNDTPTWNDLAPYAQVYGWSNGRPTCPKWGTYIIGRVNEDPRCSIGGPDHSMYGKR